METMTTITKLNSFFLLTLNKHLIHDPMKKKLLILFVSIISITGRTQIVNGGFETWITSSWEDLDTARTSNSDALSNSQLPNVTKVTPAQNGNYAAKLETTITGKDTNFAYILFGDFGDNGPKGGFPYTQKPTTINGYYKSNIVSGDSAGIIVAFRKGGVNIAMDMFKIGTSNSNYTAFSFPLTIGTYSVNPDSAVLVMASSIPTDLDPSATPKNGTWIILDNISFGGAGITQQIPNTNFELWSSINIPDPQGWYTFNKNMYVYSGKKLHAEKTTDKYKGTYALKLTTIYIDSNDVVSSVTNGHNSKSGGGYAGGIPFNKQIDTLTGYYKYIPSGLDSASIGIQFNKAGSPINYASKWLVATPSYTYFEIPFNLGPIPDTARIDISSSKWPSKQSYNGSQLFIDELQWKSSINANVNEYNGKPFAHTAFPVPGKNYIDVSIQLEQTTILELFIYDLNGKLVYQNGQKEYLRGKNTIRVNTSNFVPGNYYYNIKSNRQGIVSGKFIIQ